jgi:coenzyme F420-reducing hydrogenase alpha subunit
MSIEGELVVRVGFDGRNVRQVAIRSSRPAAVGRVARGRTPEEARALVPRLFSICGSAQTAAAAAAFAAASAHSETSAGSAGRELATVLEAAQEHAWRMLIDLPNAMAHTPLIAPVAAARQAIAPLLARLTADATAGRDAPIDSTMLDAAWRALDGLAGHVYAMPAAEWLAMTEPAALDAWTARGAALPAVLVRELFAQARGLGSSAVGLMPAATREALFATIDPVLARDPEFARAPTWDGAPVETGPLARQCAHPLVAALRARDGNCVATRIVARLTELAALLGRARGAAAPATALPAVRGHALGGGIGLAAVETARGLLLHRVRLEAGRVADYTIVAPTEWNFHPQGALALGLAGLAAPDASALARNVRIAVQALDPCVACRVEVGHA